MSDVTNKSQTIENPNRLPVIDSADLCIYSAWIHSISKDKNLWGDAFRTSTLIASILLSQQVKSVNAIPADNFQNYYWLALKTQNLNLQQSAPRFVFPQVDSKPISKGVESNTKASDSAELETIFKGLAKNWREVTGGYSLTMRRYANGSYQSILALEPKKEVISLILRELEQRPDRWFEALKALTKANPAQNAKTFEETVQRWVEWGKSENYIS